MEVLQVPFSVKAEDIFRKMRFKKNNEYLEGLVRKLLTQAKSVARPKAVYTVAYVESRDSDTLTINGVSFTSHVMSVNLDKVERVFPYVATCGRELDEMPVSADDSVETYCFGVIKEVALHKAIRHIQKHITRTYALGVTSQMVPGAGSGDWPITQQKKLFSLLGDVEKLIGVRLTPSCLMVPVKSASGILYPSEVKFESCQICLRENCIGRHAAYDINVVKRYKVADALIQRNRLC